MKNEFMKRAIELSIEGVGSGGGPFGSVIVKNDKVIAEGSNKVTLNNDPTAHGEIVAIRKACKSLNNFNLSGCELYSTCEPLMNHQNQSFEHHLLYLQFIGLILKKYTMLIQEMMLKRLILMIH